MKLKINVTEFLSLQVLTDNDITFACGLTIAISIVILIANTIALVIFSNRSLRSKKSSLLLMNMTVADGLVGSTSIVLCISHIDYFLEGDPSVIYLQLCSIFLFQLSITASIISLSAISIERVIAVCWPFSHRLARKQHYYLAIGCVWLLAFGVPVSFHLYIRDILSPFIARFITFTIVIVSCTTILISYLSIWIKIKFFTKIQQSRTMQENKNLAKTLFIVTVASLVTWSPVNIREVFHINIKGKYYKLSIQLLILSNSLINVIVYSFRIPEFKRKINDVLCLCCLTRRYRIALQNAQQSRDRVNHNVQVIYLENLSS